MTVRVLIIGAGRVAQHYSRIFRSGKLSGYNIVGICDIDEHRANALAGILECSSYQSVDTALECSNANLALVLTPSGNHFDHASKCLSMGVNVLVEKPLSMKTHDCEKLAEMANSKGLLLCTAFQNRFNKAIIHAKSLLNNSLFGEIVSVSVRLRWCRLQDYYNDGWHGSWELDGGVINQQSIHHLDALLYLIGDVDSVVCTTTRRANNLEAEDTATALLYMKCGALATFEATTAARPKDLEAAITITTTNGSISIGGLALNTLSISSQSSSHTSDHNLIKEYSEEVLNGYGNGHVQLLTAVFGEIESGRLLPPIPLADSIKTTSLVHALYTSDELRTWIYTDSRPVSARLGSESLK